MMWSNWESSWISMWLIMAVSLGGLALLIVLALRTEFAPPRRPAHHRQADASQPLVPPLHGQIDPADDLDRVHTLAEAHDA